QCSDRVRLVHDDEHLAVLLQVGDDLPQGGLVLGQLAVVRALSVGCESASVMGGLPDVEPEGDGVFGCHDRPLHLLDLGRWCHDTRCWHPRYDETWTCSSGRVPISSQRASWTPGGNTPRIIDDRARQPYQGQRPDPLVRTYQ